LARKRRAMQPLQHCRIARRARPMAVMALMRSTRAPPAGLSTNERGIFAARRAVDATHMTQNGNTVELLHH
jgi:hypothetical protein